jgi:membrane protease YdiL (CAAX protease family)
MEHRKPILYFSIALIFGYWVYKLLSPDPPAPAEFSQLALQIVQTKIIHLLTIVLLLFLQREQPGNLGFTSEKWVKQLGIGLFFGAVMFVLINVGLNSILNGIFPRTSDGGVPLLSYFSDIRNLYAWLLIGILGGGFVEELMRIFVLTRFEKAFGIAGLYGALLVSSIVFGIGHLYQGTGSAISTGLSGLILGMIFIRRRSAIEVITIHAFADVLSILAAFELAGKA